MSTTVARVRAFNRFYTRVIGVLHAKLVGSSYSLVEARLMFELAGRDHEGAELRRLLDLDAGYLSRILGKLESAGLVRRTQSPSDARRQVIGLTAEGRTAFDDLERRQIASVEELVAPLSPSQCDELTSAMTAIESALGTRPAPHTVVLRSPEPGDLGWVISRNGALYAREQGWGISYEALVATIVAEYASRPSDPREAGWIAEVDGRRVGAIFCMKDDDRTARLRLLLVDPAARGMGIGERLVGECLRFAGRSGYERITLWTVSTQHAARRIYERAGFTLDDESPFDGFGMPLTAQNWSRHLPG
ncbi:bifunctional helix-turn-helix transcriptional regulator/GNAT family N-acetyltransferase [Pseudonocardia spinosispora]|uniref:bifunctional helix-turn-helix transcriptional regulator/GNAT family N-acetyltransferase n=1 Tax=Pseudonocardia spinosispora TaxID=103441 RepID=UPI00041EB982|nr:helix-turn-helix domain-containing GNAT family N-acetyltransferase [Pseudonocardia spinosispora]